MILPLIVNRSQFLGRTKSTSALLEVLARNNALNYTGTLNYNAMGVKDGVGLVPATTKFVDNFLLKVLVPDYNVENGRNTFIGPMNQAIRALLNREGLSKCCVKAVGFAKVTNPEEYMLHKMPYRDELKQADNYYVQEYKIACPNIDYEIVMAFIRSGVYNVAGMFVRDIDITKDFCGSFDKHEIIQHLVSNHDFREQGSNDFSPRTIVDNDNTVGRNCLTYMETVDGIKTRPKIYNKFVQMLETQSVRSKVGSHWKDWTSQKGTRLAKARDLACERGLTRAEVTIYITNQEEIPSEDFIDYTLDRIEEYIPKSLVYSTPFRKAWESYCNTFKHSLVCIDRSENTALVVYSYNELTDKISGQFIHKWYDADKTKSQKLLRSKKGDKPANRWKFGLSNLTLNGNLPIDIIEACILTKTATNVDHKMRTDKVIEITGSRYFKMYPDNSTRFTTRLVSKKGLYSCNNGTLEGNVALLEKAGLVEHPNCIPYIATSKASRTSKADVTLKKMEEIDVQIGTQNTCLSTQDISQRLLNEAAKIDEIRKPLLDELRLKEENLKQLNDYVSQFKRGEVMRLRDMSQGDYDVMSVRKLPGLYGTQYQFIVDVDGEYYTVWANKYIERVLDSLATEQTRDILDEDTGCMILYNKPVAKLTVTGRSAMNSYGTTTVFCNFKVSGVDESTSIQHLKSEAKKAIESCNEEMQHAVVDQRDIVTIPRESLLTYKDYINLVTFPLHSVHTVTAIGYIPHYGRERLVVQIKDIFYQAGEDLERQVGELMSEATIRIEKIGTNRSTRIKYVICSVFKNGDWLAFVDYTKTPMLTKFDGTCKIIDVRSLEIKGQKRKIALTDNGKTYRFKKSKLEESLKPGFY